MFFFNSLLTWQPNRKLWIRHYKPSNLLPLGRIILDTRRITWTPRLYLKLAPQGRIFPTYTRNYLNKVAHNLIGLASSSSSSLLTPYSSCGSHSRADNNYSKRSSCRNRNEIHPCEKSISLKTYKHINKLHFVS